jgi:uncharacterized membrane protein/predicted DsbA family dithiol-disulfide isomerase
MKQNKQTTPLPFSIYFWTIFILAVAGLIDSIYLSISHYRVYTDIGYSSFCAISKAINCDTVSQSPYSIFIGIPVPVWGILGHSFFLLFLPLAKTRDAAKKRIWAMLFLVALVFSMYSVILAFISTFIIHSYCIMCIISYAISFLLLFYTWIIRRRFESEGIINGLKKDINFLANKKAMSLAFLGSFIIGFICVKLFFPSYWHFKAPQLSSQISTGITENGQPWIGAEKPVLTITEFADYQCFQCKKMHFFLRRLIDEHPDKIRLVHRHFPMDHRFNPIVKEPFHIGSGKMALMAIYAASKGKFWQMNDVLYEIDRESKTIDIKELAEEVRLNPEELGHSINNQLIRKKLQRDIRSGLKLQISGTPAYVIDKEVYQGQIPPEIIKGVLKR